MKILQICHRVPYPPADGGNIAMLNMARALQLAGNEIHQFALNTKKHFVDPASLPGFFQSELHFRSFVIDTRVTIGGALRNIFSSGSYNVERFFSKEAESGLEGILRTNAFDIVQLETLFTAPYIGVVRKFSRAKIILRAHNAEHVIWQRLAAAESNPARKIYLEFLSKRMKQFELEVLNKIDALVPITPVDETLFSRFVGDLPVLTVPVGIDLQDYPFHPDLPVKPSLFHLGSMDWMPNVEGVTWFLRRCWPGIHQEFPDLPLFLAGRNFPSRLMEEKFPRVICEGRIENANQYMLDKQIMLVPLLSGSGMRVKIIQGMALGKTIISTSIGAEGIDYKDGLNMLIADTPEQFLEKIRQCIHEPEWSKGIGDAGRKLVEQSYSNEAIGEKLSAFYGNLIMGKGDSGFHRPDRSLKR